jgi:hypothetical protein
VHLLETRLFDAIMASAVEHHDRRPQTDPRLVRYEQLIADLELRISDLTSASNSRGTGIIASSDLFYLMQATLDDLQAWAFMVVSCTSSLCAICLLSKPWHSIWSTLSSCWCAAMLSVLSVFS